MNSRSPIEFFGIPVEGTSLTETLKRIHDGSVRWIVTANPEILLEAHRDTHYRDTLAHANLRVADGVGLRLLSALRGRIIERTTGVELAQAIIDEAVKKQWSVAFIGGRRTASRALQVQKQRVPTLRGWAHDGGAVQPDGSGDTTNDEMLQQLMMQPADVVLVAFGHPKQERWIDKHLADLPSVKVIMGVGGTFDYWADAVKRAPEWMRAIGLEWFYRLIKEPKRWKRIWNAVVVFPITVLFSNKK